MKKEDCRIGIIGLGSMGTMFLNSFYHYSVLPRSNINCSNRSSEKIELLKKNYEHVQFLSDNAQLAEMSDVVFLCIKPIDFKNVLANLAKVNLSNKIVVSLNATVPFELIESIIGRQRIVKIVPSVTAEVFESPTLISFSQNFLDSEKEFIVELLKPMGHPEELKEVDLGFGSELMSCMPGFIASIFSEFEKVASEYGILEDERVSYLLKKTLFGTGKLLLDKEMTFGDLMRRVATKGGITMEGIKVIEDRMPGMAREIFSVTMKKRGDIAEKTERDFLGRKEV